MSLIARQVQPREGLSGGRSGVGFRLRRYGYGWRRGRPARAGLVTAPFLMRAPDNKADEVLVEQVAVEALGH